MRKKKNKKYLILSLIVLSWCIVAVVQLYNKAKSYENKCNYNYSFGGIVPAWED